MAFQAQTGVGNYDSARFRDWLPQQSHVAGTGSVGMLLQVAPPGAAGTNETHVPGNPDTLALLVWREGTPQLDARVDQPFRRTIPRGGFACVPPGAESWWASTPRSGHQVLHLHFSMAALGAVDPALGERLPSMPPGYLGVSRLLIELADLLVSEAAATGPSALLLDAAGQLALHTLLDRHARTPPSAGRVGRLAAWQTRRAIEYIEAHLGDSIPLATLAATVRLSPFHFARCFQASLGEPPHRYQVRRRIERARELLTTTDLRVLDIALAVGYESPQALARAFRRTLGVSPAQYRRELLVSQATVN